MPGAPRDHLELVAEQAQVLADHGHVLDRPVVQIEPKASELALARLDESPLSGGIAGQQSVSLEDRSQHGHRLREEPITAFANSGSGGADERSERLLPATHRFAEQQTPLAWLGGLTRE